MKISTLSYVVMAAAVLLGGCASTPERFEPLENARSQVQQLSSDPLSATAASKQLEDARKALNEADAAHEKGKSRKEVEHLSYLASRAAEVGLSAVAEARAREQVAKGEAQRNLVLLQSREREAAAATREAKDAQAQAQLAKDQARTQTQDAEAARAELQRLQQEFADLQAKKTDRGMVLTLGDVLFDTGKATLKPGADLTVTRLGTFMTDHTDMKIMIEGHTDSVGTSEYNQGLSERRARAVADALEARGISNARFEVRGRGEDYPVAGNDDAAGRQENRRVEIVFSDPTGQFAQSGR